MAVILVPTRAAKAATARAANRTAGSKRRRKLIRCIIGKLLTKETRPTFFGCQLGGRLSASLGQEGWPLIPLNRHPATKHSRRQAEREEQEGDGLVKKE